MLASLIGTRAFHRRSYNTVGMYCITHLARLQSYLHQFRSIHKHDRPRYYPMVPSRFAEMQPLPIGNSHWGNFRFVLDKSDLKSVSDKKFIQKATVTLENKICKQNTILHFLTLHALQPTVELIAFFLFTPSILSLLVLDWWQCKEVGVYVCIEPLSIEPT